MGIRPRARSMATPEAMPITLPRMSITGPPLLPPYRAASIWSRFSNERRTWPLATLTLTVEAWDLLPRGKPRVITGESLGMLCASIFRSRGRGFSPSGTRSILRTAKSSLRGDETSCRIRASGLATPTMVRRGVPSVRKAEPKKYTSASSWLSNRPAERVKAFFPSNHRSIR